MNTLLQSNGEAARQALGHGASACTDITGFGLAGHLLEMLQGGLGARLALDSLPMMPGALPLFQAGFHSTMQAPNQRSVGSALQHSVHEGDARLSALFDPQTSGGLLVSIAAERAPDLLAALREVDYRDAEVIGEIVALPPGETRVLHID